MRCIVTLANHDQLKELTDLCSTLGVSLVVEDEPAAEAHAEAEETKAETEKAPGAASEPEVTIPAEIVAPAETAETQTPAASA